MIEYVFYLKHNTEFHPPPPKKNVTAMSSLPAGFLPKHLPAPSKLMNNIILKETS